MNSTSAKFSSFLVTIVNLSCTSSIGWFVTKFRVGDITGGFINVGDNIGPGASLNNCRLFWKTSNFPLQDQNEHVRSYVNDPILAYHLLF